MNSIYDYVINGTTTYYYLLFNQHFKNMCHSLYTFFFDLEDIKIRSNNKVCDVFYKYSLLKTLSRLNHYVSLQYLIYYADVKFDLVHLKKTDNDNTISCIGNRNTFNTSLVSELIPKLDTILMVQPNMVKVMIIDFYLTNHNNRKLCLKNFISQYNDPEKILEHSLYNILLFNKIDYNKYNKLIIKVCNPKIIKKEISLDKVIDHHINDLIDTDIIKHIDNYTL